MRVIRGKEVVHREITGNIALYPVSRCIVYQKPDTNKIVKADVLTSNGPIPIHEPEWGWLEDDGTFILTEEPMPVIDNFIQFDRKTSRGWWVTVLHEPFRDASFFIGTRKKLLELFEQQGADIPVPILDANGEEW